MNRHIVYPGQIPLDTDLLNSIQDSFYGAGWLALSVIGPSIATVGLAVTPTVPASLSVNVAPGAIYSLQTVDTSSYGSLGTDSNQIVKQGLSKASQTLVITPPSTSGQSQNYLVQVAFQETDTSAIILPYYNATNPSVAWSGPNNSGTSQNTIRQDNCVIGLKAGVPAATGSQTTPSPDAGYTGIYVITVANGQTTITSANISQLTTAPYFPTLTQVPSSVQNKSWSYTVAGGTANALTATIYPIPAAYTAGMEVLLKVSATNTAAATLNLNGLGAVSITRADGSTTQAADLQTGSIVGLRYDGTNFQIDGLNTSFLPGRNTTVYSTAGTYTFTVPAGVYKLYCICVGAGGGAGGFGVGSGGTAYPAGGGGAGGTALGWISVTPGQTITVIIGAGGSGGAASSSGSAGSYGTNGSTGGTTSIGAFMSATGGSGGGATVAGTFGGVGGLGTGGQINQAGGNGTDGAGGIGSFVYGGNGGASSQGGGGRAATTFSTSVQNGRAPGSGGGSVYNGTWASNGAGGSGADGFVIFQY